MLSVINSETMPSLLVQSCSKSKNRPTSAVPPLELYSGYYFKIIKKAMRKGVFDPTLEVCVLSAEHGLLRTDEPISWYDRRMDEHRACELKDEVKQELQSIVNGTYEQVIVNVGQSYRHALGNPQEYLDVDVNFIEGEGMGAKGHILKRVVRGESEALDRHRTVRS
jgi:hypothetical protein